MYKKGGGRVGLSRRLSDCLISFGSFAARSIHLSHVEIRFIITLLCLEMTGDGESTEARNGCDA